MIIYRYILKAHIGPFFFAFSTVVFLFLFQFLIKSIEQLVGKGLSIWVIIQLISLNLAWIVTLAVPMAVLVATLMAFGSLSSTNEIAIMRASGISLYKLMAPVLICAAVITYLMVRFNNEVLPEANHKARILFTDITKTKPTFILEPGRFSNDLAGIKILVQKTFENSNKLEGIYISDYSNPSYRNIITAESGDISFSSDFKNIIMNLNNGEIHQLNNIDFSDEYRIVKFEKHRITMDAFGFGFQRSNDNTFTRGDRELSAQDMDKIVDSLKVNLTNSNESILKNINDNFNKLDNIKFVDTSFFKNNLKRPTINNNQKIFSSIQEDSSNTIRNNIVFDSLNNLIKKFANKNQEIATNVEVVKSINKQINTYDVEIYKKYSIPFACLIFVLVGAPLGYRVKKGGFGIAAGLSLLFFLLYWISLIGGEKLADRGIISPFWGMWLANIILGIFGLYLLFKSS